MARLCQAALGVCGARPLRLRLVLLIQPELWLKDAAFWTLLRLRVWGFKNIAERLNELVFDHITFKV